MSNERDIEAIQRIGRNNPGLLRAWTEALEAEVANPIADHDVEAAHARVEARCRPFAKSKPSAAAADGDAVEAE